MQEYGSAGSSKSGEYRDGNEGRERAHQSDSFQGSQQYSVNQKNYGCANKDLSEQNMATYCRVATGIYEATSSSHQYQNPRYNNQSAPTFSSPPNSPLVGLVFDPSSPNYSGSGMMQDRNPNPDKRSQASWSPSNQEPIGTGAKKKIVKNQDNKRNAFSADSRYQERYKNVDHERQRKAERNLNSESTFSLDFFVEGEKMVSELCNIPETSSKNDCNDKQKSNNSEDDKSKSSMSSEILLSVLDKFIIHDQIPTQIVQLAIEACTDAENIAIAHHNRPCFKNIHSICAKTRSNVQKPDSAVANLHSQGIPWVIKNFIFSFVRILDGWKGVKELLSEKHDTFSRIENNYYSPNIRECFVQWQAVTKEMLTHIYKTFKCLDDGFAMEQKSFTHNYYATNSAAPRHQNKFQPSKPHASTPRPVNSSPQPYNAVQPPWMQNQSQATSQAYSDGPWPARQGVTYKKFPIVPPPNSHNFYPLSEQCVMETYQKSHFKCDPCSLREAKPRQSWTITNMPEFRAMEGMCLSDQRELYNQLKHKMLDAELGKAPGQPITGNISCGFLQRRDMELKAKMIPLSHVEKTLIPSMAAAEVRGYVQKNNSCGDTKEEADFFAAWGQMVQKEPNDYIAHHTHNVPINPNVVTISNNISGPVQFIEPENDEFHEMSKVYMKPGSYKVPIKPTDPVPPYVSPTSENMAFDNVVDEVSALKKPPYPPVNLASQAKYSVDSWPCLMPKCNEDVILPMNCINVQSSSSLEFLGGMISDRAWEAAKQSAPKLMDILNEGSKSDAARLYDALGLNTSEELPDDLKQLKLDIEQSDPWSTGLTPKQLLHKQISQLWEQQNSSKSDDLNHSNIRDRTILNDVIKLLDSETKVVDQSDDPIEFSENKTDDSKENTRCANFDQTGSYVRDENQKKGKSRVAISGMWYHPKKKKPLPTATVKKFETIIANLSQINEAEFIQHDMDIKMAPRFYEVVKYPMCLNDILTKLKNSSYSEYTQVVQDFRRIFNNVRLYLKSYPDANMKKYVNKVSVEFEKILNEEFPNHKDAKPKTQDFSDKQENSKDNENKEADANKKSDSKNHTEDKK